MQVEVNEQNIILYKLVELTGNSAEEMLVQAREAWANGYTLTCEVPDDQVVHANTFDVFSDGRPSSPENDKPEHPLNPMFDNGKVVPGEVVDVDVRIHSINLTPDGLGRIELVERELSDPDFETGHIPFPPDMVPFDDEED